MCAWLEREHMREHVASFQRERVDGKLLLQIDDEDLRAELGVSSRLQRKRLLAHIASLAGGSMGDPR